MRRTFLALIAGSIMLAGCASSRPGIEGVAVSNDKTPRISVSGGFSSPSTVSRIIIEGDGDELALGDAVKLDYVAINGRTSQEFDNSYSGSAPMLLALNSETTLPGLLKGLVGQKVGTRVLIAVTGSDGAALLKQASKLGLESDDTILFLFDILGKTPLSATGSAVELPADAPRIVMTEDRPSSVERAHESPKRLTEMEIFVAIEGTGPVIEHEQNVGVQYIAQSYANGLVFDDTWPTGPRPVLLGQGQYPPCWEELLVGQRVGSRVILACPGDKTGRGTTTSQSSGDDVIYVIDLLAAI